VSDGFFFGLLMRQVRGAKGDTILVGLQIPPDYQEVYFFMYEL
jgi:hypothetical protein